VGWGTPFATACNTLNELLLAAANAVAYSGTHLRPAIYQTLYITDSLTVLAIFFPVVTFIPIFFVGGIDEFCAGRLLRLVLRRCLLLRTTLGAFGPLR
jgi:hypothetical protein